MPSKMKKRIHDKFHPNYYIFFFTKIYGKFFYMVPINKIDDREYW